MRQRMIMVEGRKVPFTPQAPVIINYRDVTTIWLAFQSLMGTPTGNELKELYERIKLEAPGLIV